MSEGRDPKPTPASLPEKLRHLGRILPMDLPDSDWSTLNDAADRLEAYECILKVAQEEIDSLDQQLTAARSEATFQKERADGYSSWITEFEKREARLREALKQMLHEFTTDSMSNLEKRAADAARAALEVEGEHE